jgi:hypothetical protein
MTLKDLLAAKKEEILQRWLNRILEDYPPDTQTFFRQNKSPYSNPIGFTLLKGMQGVIDQISRPLSAEEARSILEPVMKVRAVENLPHCQKEKFILPLGEIVSEIVREEKRKDLISDQGWIELNSRIRWLVLLSMDLYSECREKVNRLRMKEGGKKARAVQDRRVEV